MALTRIKWNKADNEIIVPISKVEVCEIMNWNVDSSDRSVKVRNLAKKLAKNSWIEIEVLLLFYNFLLNIILYPYSYNTSFQIVYTIMRHISI